MNIIAGMACKEDRWPESFECMLSLKGQVDALYVALNGFERVPNEISNEPWIVVSHLGRNIGDIGKFADVECDAFISCDDDLVYPKGYVAQFLEDSKRFPGQVLAHHGNTAQGATNSYFKMRYNSERIQCLMRNEQEITLTIPGTGVTFFPGEVYAEFYSRLIDGWNHADLIAGRVLADMGVGITSVKHPKHFFRYVKPKDGTTIWEQNVKWDKKMTAIWNKLGL